MTTGSCPSPLHPSFLLPQVSHGNFSIGRQRPRPTVGAAHTPSSPVPFLQPELSRPWPSLCRNAPTGVAPAAWSASRQPWGLGTRLEARHPARSRCPVQTVERWCDSARVTLVGGVTPFGIWRLLCCPGHRSPMCNKSLGPPGSCGTRTVQGRQEVAATLRSAAPVYSWRGVCQAGRGGRGGRLGGGGRAAAWLCWGSPGSPGLHALRLSADFSGVCSRSWSADRGERLSLPLPPPCCSAPSPPTPGRRELLRDGQARGPGAGTVSSRGPEEPQVASAPAG